MAKQEPTNAGFKYEVAARPGAENITACFSCGVCTAGCPVSEVDDRYNPRKIVRMIMWGMREELLSSEIIWLCNLCYSCHTHCPQDVKFTDVITNLREMAVEDGYAREDFQQTVERIDTAMQMIRRDLTAEVFSSGKDVVEAEQLDTEAIVQRLITEGERGADIPCPETKETEQ